MKISVIIPVYNHRTALERAIQSVKAQQYSDIETIIVDDGSEEPIADVVDQHDRAKMPITFIEQANAGANAARNRGIRLADGDIVSFLDADDELMPSYSSRVVDALADSPDSIAGVCTGYEIMRGGKRDHFKRPPKRITAEHIRKENVIGGFSCTAFKRDAIQEVGGLDERFSAVQDYEFFMRILERYSMYGIPTLLARYHADGSVISSDLDRRITGHQQFIAKHGEKLTARGRANAHYRLSFYLGRAGDIQGARRELRKSIEHDPLRGWYYYHLFSTFFGVDGYADALSLKKYVKCLVDRYGSHPIAPPR